jgi:hypothetical protein
VRILRGRQRGHVLHGQAVISVPICMVSMDGGVRVSRDDIGNIFCIVKQSQCWLYFYWLPKSRNRMTTMLFKDRNIGICSYLVEAHGQRHLT